MALDGSAKRSRDFYRALGPAGLAIRTKPEWDAQVLVDLRGLLPARGRVLDVGCGYGRIAIPLAELGYDVTGFDISRNLLREARREAMRRGITAAFHEGSMTELPYRAGSFDVVLSLWTAFYELVVEDEQRAALGEMDRVLGAGGLGIIEGPVFEPATDEEIRTGARHGDGNRIVASLVGGHRLEYFAHDPASLARVAGSAGIVNHEVVVRDWGGRPRQLLLFRH